MGALKNLYTPELVHSVADSIRKISPSFAMDRFKELVFDEQWEQEELKQRMRHVTMALTATLPASYEEALDILRSIAPQYRGVEYLFFPDFVEVNGLDEWELSMKALADFTLYTSSEFAVRPFIRQDTERMMQQMRNWSTDSNEHIRRLASEGCRPRLPWGSALEQFKKDPSLILPILEQLKADESLYVRKSVANNLNDIAKDHPNIVLQLAESWQGRHPHTDWIIRHGCRSLLKQSHPEALRLFGLSGAEGIEVDCLALSHCQLAIGEELGFTVHLHNNSGEPRKLRVEYEIDYRKASGKLSPKRFKLSEREYAPGTVMLIGKQSFKLMTTRRYYAGLHQLNIFVNGERKASVSFELV